MAVGESSADGRLAIAGVWDVGFKGQFADVGVCVGNGDGTFAWPVTYSTGSNDTRFVSMVQADFNQDGKPDLAALISGPSGTAGVVSVLLGNGDGTFQTAKTFTVGTGPISMVSGDFNAGGRQHLA